MEFTKLQQLMQTVINEAWENESFKNKLKENPKAAIEELTGEKVHIPEGKKLVVRDQTNESTLYINIPPKNEMDDVELNEEQLEVVAGGNPLEHAVTTWPVIFNPPIIFNPPVIDKKL